MLSLYYIGHPKSTHMALSVRHRGGAQFATAGPEPTAIRLVIVTENTMNTHPTAPTYQKVCQNNKSVILVILECVI